MPLRKHRCGRYFYNISEPGSISVIRYMEVEDHTHVGPIEAARLDY
jgi:hypothetical protein